MLLEIRASEHNVRRYVDSYISHLPSFVKRSLDLQEEIKVRIVKAVDRMYVSGQLLEDARWLARFLLAQLHLDSLIGKRTPKAICTTLQKLLTRSDVYDYAYKDAMERIGG